MAGETAAPDRADDDAEATDAEEEGERARKRAEAVGQQNYQACLGRATPFITNNAKPAGEEVSIPY